MKGRKACRNQSSGSEVSSQSDSEAPGVHASGFQSETSESARLVNGNCEDPPSARADEIGRESDLEAHA